MVAAPLTIWIVLAGGAWLAGLLAIASAIGAWELFRIARAGGSLPLDGIGIALAGVTPLFVHAAFLGYPRLPLSGVATIFVGLLAAAIWVRGVGGKPLSAVAITVFGVAYTGGMLSFAYAIRYHRYAIADSTIAGWAIPSGGLLLLLPLLVTWGSDIGAYAVGRLIGRHKLIPSVSPGKTVEGAVGGLIASALVSALYVSAVLRPSTQLGMKWGVAGALVFGAVISVAAQVGDLAESMLKREAGVKDSSKILPGHGGILDRLDSVFVVLPVSYLLLGAMMVWAGP